MWNAAGEPQVQREMVKHTTGCFTIVLARSGSVEGQLDIIQPTVAVEGHGPSREFLTFFSSGPT